MLFDDTYKTISAPAEGIFRDRGSKFIAEAFPVLSEHEMKNILNKTKKKHAKANHHCFAFRMTPDKNIFKINDDNEPSGTAGRPILNAILSNDLTDIAIIVSRYFGGTLLGVPGLIHAYNTAAINAITNAVLISKTIDLTFQLQFDYNMMNDVMHIIKKYQAVLIDQNINELCTVVFSVRKSKSELVLNSFYSARHLFKNYELKQLK